MTNIVQLSLVFTLGLGLGLFYFGTLWLTVQQLPRVRRPEMLTLGSFLVRTSICLLGFYLIMAGRWERLLLAALGFLIMRTILVRSWGPAPPRQLSK
ncbi:MAG: ATP synthase subunit I [Desulfobacteraceae bacterium]